MRLLSVSVNGRERVRERGERESGLVEFGIGTWFAHRESWCSGRCTHLRRKTKRAANERKRKVWPKTPSSKPFLSAHSARKVIGRRGAPGSPDFSGDGAKKGVVNMSSREGEARRLGEHRVFRKNVHSGHVFLSSKGIEGGEKPLFPVRSLCSLRGGVQKGGEG